MLHRCRLRSSGALAFVLMLLNCNNELYAQQELMYGVTLTDLVRINPDDPSQVTNVGPHNLGSVYPDSNPRFALTYDPSSSSLFGIAARTLPGNDIEYSLVRFNTSTGQASLGPKIGSNATGNSPEGLEYVHSLQSLVISRITPPNSLLSQDIVKLAPDGTQMLIVTTPGFDNDALVYDSARNLLYGINPNDPLQFARIDLMNGNTTNMGAIPTTIGDVAYSASRDASFGVDFTNNQLYRIKTTNGGTPITQTSVGTIGGNPVRGIAFAMVPEPVSTVFVAAGAVFLFLSFSRTSKRSRRLIQ